MGHLHRFADRAAGAQTVRAADIQGVCRWLLHPSSHSGLSNHSTKAGQCQSDAGTLSPPTGRRARGPGSGRDQTAVAATSCPWKVTLATGQEAGARPLTSCQVRLWAGWAPDLPAGESPSSAANPGRGSVRQPWGQGVCELVLASENKARRRVIAKQPRAAFSKSGFKTGWCFCESGLTGAIGGWAGTMWAAGGGDSALCPCLTLGMGLGEGPDGQGLGSGQCRLHFWATSLAVKSVKPLSPHFSWREMESVGWGAVSAIRLVPEAGSYGSFQLLLFTQPRCVHVIVPGYFFRVTWPAIRVIILISRVA